MTTAPSADPYTEIVTDLIGRVEIAIEQTAHLAIDTGITFLADDIIRIVEDGLPSDYPAPTCDHDPASQTENCYGRSELIRDIAQDALTGELYQEA